MNQWMEKMTEERLGRRRVGGPGGDKEPKKRDGSKLTICERRQQASSVVAIAAFAYLNAAFVSFTPLTRMSPVTSPVDLRPASTSRRVVLPAEQQITA
jgi:hypothetical protein